MNYNENNGWNAYYQETDTAKRKSILDRLLQELPDDGANKLRAALFQERYPESMGGRDAFLMRCRYELSLYHQKDALFTSIGRDTRKTVTQFHLDHPDALSEAEKSALYHEFRNIARCHLKEAEDPNYGSRLFGFLKMKEEQKRQRLCEEIWSMSRGAALYSECGKKLRIYCDAFHDELMDYDPSLNEQYDRLDEDLVRTLPH